MRPTFLSPGPFPCRRSPRGLPPRGGVSSGVFALALVAATACRTPKPPGDAGAGLVDDEAQDSDGDGFVGAEDCAEGDASVNAGASERCDGIDNNCDGQVDEGVLDQFYVDADRDGFGDADEVVEACALPPGAVSAGTDCDDADPSVFPSAPEICDGVDNDCDSVVDDDDVVDWYTDADGDGYGDPGTRVASCAPVAGAVTVAGDCDDTTADVSPGGTERCDERDNDCDGAVDEGVGTTWYEDKDADGYGIADRTVAACAAPLGYAARFGDCDDLDAAFNPGALEDDCSDPTDYNCDGSVTFADLDADGFAACQDCDDRDAAVRPDASEVCNGTDDDCDGLIDDADADLDPATTVVFYDDDDGDGAGDLGDPVRACVAPAGAVATSGDCDDRDPTRAPGLVERCGGGDEDCDGLVDDADPSLNLGTALAWHRDADGDAFGDPADVARACAAPLGRVADDTDCDDGDAWIFPGAPERPDGVDNDCNAVVDEDLHLGTGADGDLVVTGPFDLSTDSSGGRAHPDGVSFPVTALGADAVTVSGPALGLSVGDEVMIINLQGAPGRTAAVGRYALHAVAGVAGSTVQLARPLGVVLGPSSNTDIADQVIVLVRIPNYNSVTVEAAGVISTGAWDGLVGGVLALRARDTVLISPGGSISVAALGYAGGGTGLASNCDSFQGESITGPGEGAAFGTCAAYNESYGLWASNAGGGGAHICGGGGAYGPGATATDSWNGGSATPAQAGVAYGSADLAGLFLGSGGGGVWYGSTACVGTGPGPGGDGGGLLYLTAGTLTARGSDAILAGGGATTHCAKGTWEYGAGGGAGGTVWLVADALTLATDGVDATGGSGEKRNIRRGGDGGQGRVRVDCGLCNGLPFGSTGATAALGAAAEPDPGFGAVP